MPVMPAYGGLRQEKGEFEVNPGCTARPSPKSKWTKANPKKEALQGTTWGSRTLSEARQQPPQGQQGLLVEANKIMMPESPKTVSPLLSPKALRTPPNSA